MSSTDTLRLFLFHSDSVDYLGWNKIRDDYMVLVRYDLSQEDIYRLNTYIDYPPTEAMKDIHMYPPETCRCRSGEPYFAVLQL